MALTAVVYAAAYLVWERSDWGSATVRDLLGNIAFMPLNLAVLALYFLAARSPVLDPGVRRALRFLALGSTPEEVAERLDRRKGDSEAPVSPE